MKVQLFLRASLLFYGFFSVACATYQTKVERARTLLSQGSHEEALVSLKPLAEAAGKDQLIYLMDYATALQAAGKWAESNTYFYKADKLSDIQDYTSLSLESGSFLTGEEMVQYKGEDFEIVLINAMSAINYLSLGEMDEALVEVRRFNEKIRRFRQEAKRLFTDNAFALYLSALIYETHGQWDDATIAYEKVYDLAPNYPPLAEDLIRSNGRAHRQEALKKWQARFPLVDAKEILKPTKSGEVVIIYESGWAPRKAQRYDDFRFPMMRPVWSSQSTIQPQLTFQGEAAAKPIEMADQPILFDVEPIAIQSLESQYAALVARRMAGIVAKRVMAERIRQDNELAGSLALLAMTLSDRADLRQWSTLPKAFKIYRARVPAGIYELRIDGQEKNSRLEVKPGGKVFVTHRTFQ